MLRQPIEIFREEAIRCHDTGCESEGEVLRISPAWTGKAYHLLLVIVAAGALYAGLGTIDEYASGPAIVRVEGRTDVTATAASTVTSVDVQPGQHVAPNDVLVTFHLSDEAGELERMNREFELQMIRFLRDPSDQVARSSLTTLRAERQRARKRVEERSVTSPQAGLVSDVRIRVGQHLSPGDVVVSLVGLDTRIGVIAMLPGHARPMLHVGTPLRLELAGYKYAYHDVRIESVGDEIVGPAAVRAYLGPNIGDAVVVPGPVVLVKAHLPSRTFHAGEQSFSYYEGMLANADARVRSHRVLVAMIPALQSVFDNANR